MQNYPSTTVAFQELPLLEQLNILILQELGHTLKTNEDILKLFTQLSLHLAVYAGKGDKEIIKQILDCMKSSLETSSGEEKLLDRFIQAYQKVQKS